ncbi:hypothetical protein [Papillibacter cinnamivorans]|uniref:Uncharacterized protein n=1 Tax=Papillibacter cinnamivorans DSM 12816 TaxID=1122930 RepID=A0A1W1YPY8_9FIRM|nr:hypothetical protein [Papillibacter cinnamivorans]SMC38265.1 hypothetical protein SAMN02745168_0610 [Papillibacter cinnamivorans DSM 12816]
MKAVVGVKFQSKYDSGSYEGREYSYFVADGLDLHVGDIVPVTTRSGEGLAKVTRTGIREGEIDERVMPYMRTIESGPVDPAPMEV